MKLGKVLRTYRERKGWTQGQLAIRAGLLPEHISMIERGVRKKPNIETIAKIIMALGVDVDTILAEAGLLPPPAPNSPPTAQESRLLEIIRSIPTSHIRESTLELIIGFATVARDADLARREESEEDEDTE